MDKRVLKEYLIHTGPIGKDTTFYGYKKTEAFKELKENIKSGILDRSIFWSIELDISGYSENLWDTLIVLACEEVNISNPNLPKILYKSFYFWYELSKLFSHNNKNKLDFHNFQVLRNQLMNLICILCLSTKSKIPKIIKWKRNEKLNINKWNDKIKRNNLDYIQNIVKISDSPKIYTPLNEIDRALGSNSNASIAREDFIFWLSWLLEIQKRHKKIDLCAPRNVPEIKEKSKKDIVWCIWQIIFHNSEKKKIGPHLQESLINLYKLFRMGYTATKRNKKIPIIIYAGLLLIGSIPVIDFRKNILIDIKSSLIVNLRVNLIYKDIFYQRKLEENQEKYKPNIKSKILVPILFIPIIQKNSK